MGTVILETLAVIAAGMMTGNELCVIIFHAQLRGLDERAQFELGKKSAAVFGKLMPPWYAATLLLSAVVAYLLRGSGAAALLADVSAALWLLSILGTVLLLVPINSRIAGWTWDTRPADWAEARQTWDTRHSVRVSLLVLAMICLVLACLLPHSR